MLAAATEDELCAARLALQLGLPLLPTDTDPGVCTQVSAVLITRGRSLCLQQTGRGAPGPVQADFGSLRLRHRRRSGNNELLGRAVGLGKKVPLRILDATAGLGSDAFVLADLGCELELCEREPVILELLRAGLELAAGGDDPWLASVAQRMQLRAGDAVQIAATEMQGVDVIYLDPMFPPRTKTAAVKKEMALLQVLLAAASDPRDADALLQWALQQDVARVVVKRPAKAANLAGLAPSHSISGKAVRYDVYVKRKLV